MKKGSIVEHGTTNEILRHPQQTYTRQLIDAIQLSNIDDFEIRYEIKSSSGSI